MMGFNILGHCRNILEEMSFSSPPEMSSEPYIHIYTDMHKIYYNKYGKYTYTFIYIYKFEFVIYNICLLLQKISACQKLYFFTSKKRNWVMVTLIFLVELKYAKTNVMFDILSGNIWIICVNSKRALFIWIVKLVAV